MKVEGELPVATQHGRTAPSWGEPLKLSEIYNRVVVAQTKHPNGSNIPMYVYGAGKMDFLAVPIKAIVPPTATANECILEPAVDENYSSALTLEGFQTFVEQNCLDMDVPVICRVHTNQHSWFDKPNGVASDEILEFEVGNISCHRYGPSGFKFVLREIIKT